ncbi:metal ABC transporter solute-binding protein, Zn/Mn family [Tychonema sp. LEGE 07203]|uniref:metal ABC transporter solute-binding protein, Zn/Mn family n=1 Tax=Tychonema sp. LEGE 07203 TaxID=1828671 RepID=UPI001880E984|nr:zinc ABC transporter substrate-binding protein [Tychonema sp. LEGE 07203]MBE9095220.1 zinc ABC transporter substrate-binding protein [Tychonema sp. LEGE 07203]
MLQKFNLKSLAVFGLMMAAGSSSAGSTFSPTNKNQIVAQSRPQVVATSTVICGLTKEIAGNTIDLKCLVDAGSDPHVYQPKPDDRKAIEQAKLILYSGYNFEPSLIRLIKASSNKSAKIAVGEAAVPKALEIEEDGKKVSDPHIWHDAKNGMAMAKIINTQLGKVLPNQASAYNAKTKQITSNLTKLDTWIKSKVATIPAKQRKLVTTHDAFNYYSKAYEIPVIGALEGLSTDEAPTPTRVAQLVREIKASGVPTIFAESTINPKLIEAVAKEAKVKVSPRELFADGLGEPGSEADSYQKMLVANTRTIVEGLGGKYTLFKP